MEDTGNSHIIGEVIKDELWHAFTFEADPDDKFELLPFYMGTSEGFIFSLHMVVVNQYEDPDTHEMIDTPESFELWSAQSPTGVLWSSKQPNENNPTPMSDFNELVGSNGQNAASNGGTKTAKQLGSRPYLTIDFSNNYGPIIGYDNQGQAIRGPIQENTIVYFYIYIDSGKMNLNETGDKLTSIANKPNLVAIDLPPEMDALTNNQGYNAMLIGCETANQNVYHAQHSADFDYNDLMFFIVGDIPDIFYNEMLQTTVIKKRYMIEDLYGFDYDFNDIVVDATDTSVRYYKVDPDNGSYTEQSITIDNVTYPTDYQEATVYWLCGTLPFQVKIGNHTFGQVTDPTNTVVDVISQLDRPATTFGGDITPPDTPAGFKPNVTKTITGWNPDDNNIKVFIWTKGTNDEDPDPTASYSYTKEGLWTGPDGIWVSTFPNQGDVPYIIAVDQDDKYIQEEFHHIPKSWLGGDMSTDNSTTTTEELINN
jgi:hypothetical protein